MDNFQILELYWFKEGMFQPVPPVVNITVKSEFVRRISRLKAMTRQETYVYPDIEALSRNHYCRTKSIIVTYSECFFVALGIQNAMRMHHIFICDLSGFTIFFHIISQTVRLSEKQLLNMKYLWWFSLQIMSETFVILGIMEPDVIINVHRPSCNLPVILVGF
jgi:hypothetical protein